jgi:hypothetical protein
MYSTMGLATEAKRGLLSLVMPACAKVMSYDMLTGVFGVFAIVALYGEVTPCTSVHTSLTE